MRLSPQRHTLAVLRILLNLTQKEMAELAGCSRPTIQAVELGKLHLSDRLAGLIALRTGVALKWLLDNDVSVPPLTREGSPFTMEVFHETRALASSTPPSPLNRMQPIVAFSANIFRLGNLLLQAHKIQKSQLCAYKIAKAFDDLEDQFGVSDSDDEYFGSPMSLSGPTEKPFYEALSPLLEQFSKGIHAVSPGKPTPLQGPLKFTITRDGQITATAASAEDSKAPQSGKPKVGAKAKGGRSKRAR